MDETPDGDYGDDIHYRRSRKTGQLFLCVTWCPGWFAILPFGPTAGTTKRIPLRVRPISEMWTDPIPESEIAEEIAARNESAVSSWKESNLGYFGTPSITGAVNYVKTINGSR